MVPSEVVVRFEFLQPFNARPEVCAQGLPAFLVAGRAAATATVAAEDAVRAGRQLRAAAAKADKEDEAEELWRVFLASDVKKEKEEEAPEAKVAEEKQEETPEAAPRPLKRLRRMGDSSAC